MDVAKDFRFPSHGEDRELLDWYLKLFSVKTSWLVTTSNKYFHLRILSITSQPTFYLSVQRSTRKILNSKSQTLYAGVECHQRCIHKETLYVVPTESLRKDLSN